MEGQKLIGDTASVNIVSAEQAFATKLLSDSDAVIIIGLKGEGVKARPRVSIPAVIEGMPVKEIGDGAFRSCKALVSAILPCDITKISAHAFYGCTTLETVTLPPSLEYIGDGAFYGCVSLRDVIHPLICGNDTAETMAQGDSSPATGRRDEDSRIEMGHECFGGCSSLSLKDQAAIRRVERAAGTHGHSPLVCFLLAYKNYYNFTGRTTRREYWIFLLWFAVLFLLLSIAGLVALQFFGNETLFLIAAALLVSSAIPVVTASVRRMRDTGTSWWHCIIPVYNILLLCNRSRDDESVRPSKRPSVLRDMRDVILALATVALLTCAIFAANSSVMSGTYDGGQKGTGTGVEYQAVERCIEPRRNVEL